MNNATPPSMEQQMALIAKIRADIAKRERFEATRAGCSAWHVMTKGVRR